MNAIEQRTPLTADRVVHGAVALADEIGIEAFTMRKLAEFLGVKPMSIYHHVSSKEEILDGMVDIVFGEIGLPPAEVEWQEAMRQRCVSARTVLNRHPWAPPLMESRQTPGPATLGHHDAVVGCLRRGGLSFELTAHAYAVIDSYLYGFALQEANLPFGGGEEIGELAEDIVMDVADEQYPDLVEFVANTALQPGYSFGRSFDFGLDLIIEGVARAPADEPVV
jgi:AcrR family transcriptional regulator